MPVIGLPSKLGSLSLPGCDYFYFRYFFFAQDRAESVLEQKYFWMKMLNVRDARRTERRTACTQWAVRWWEAAGPVWACQAACQHEHSSQQQGRASQSAAVLSPQRSSFIFVIEVLRCWRLYLLLCVIVCVSVCVVVCHAMFNCMCSYV